MQQSGNHDEHLSKKIEASDPALLSEAMVQAVVNAILEGYTREYAAWIAGLTFETFKRYVAMGEKGHTRYQYFYNSLIAAEQTAINKRAQVVREVTQAREKDAAYYRELARRKLEEADAQGDITPALALELAKFAANEEANLLGVGVQKREVSTKSKISGTVGVEPVSLEDIIRQRREQRLRDQAIEGTLVQSAQDDLGVNSGDDPAE